MRVAREARVGHTTGLGRVGWAHTAPAPVDTVPAQGTGQTRPAIPAVAHHTCRVDGNRRFLPFRRDENACLVSSDPPTSSPESRRAWTSLLASRFRVVAASSSRRARRSSQSRPVRCPSRRRNKHDARLVSSRTRSRSSVVHRARHRRCMRGPLGSTTAPALSSVENEEVG